MKHNLKCLPEYFQVSWVGKKSFEIRVNDRNFNIWDEIVLQEYTPTECDYSGREIEGVITYITNFKQAKDHVVFQYEITGRNE